MWILKNKPIVQRASKKMATEVAEMRPAPNDRPLSTRRLDLYNKEVAQGTMRPVTWATAYCKETGEIYRVNGKHTSTLIAQSEQPLKLFITMEEYVCDTLEDVARLYATFDSKIGVRNASDIYMSFASTIPELRDIHHPTINLAVSGMAYGEWKENVPATQPIQRAELLLKHPEFVLWLDRLFYPTNGTPNMSRAKHLRRQAVVGACFTTWQKSQSDATKFWEAVRDETGPSPTTADRTLASYLTRTGVESGAGARTRVRTAPTREMYSKCIHAWNAWRKDETTSLKYYIDADIPIPR